MHFKCAVYFCINPNYIRSCLYSCCDLASFDCSVAKKNVQAHYDKLTNLPNGLLFGKLLAKGVITHEEKENIDLIPTEPEKMICLLDTVIIPSLSSRISMKFKGFLEAMEESGDSDLIDVINQLGMY